MARLAPPLAKRSSTGCAWICRRIALSNFGASLNVPDGLTVHSAKWDIVPFNDDFSGGTEKTSVSRARLWRHSGSEDDRHRPR